LKENIADLSAEKAQDVLDGLSPVTSNYKVDKAEKHVGFIAEDVPECAWWCFNNRLMPKSIRPNRARRP